jgi:kynurenine 3-monooxygenase
MPRLPPQDKTFTATLFMPYAKFDALETADDISDFFMAEFPDFVPLLGRCVRGLGWAGLGRS